MIARPSELTRIGAASLTLTALAAFALPNPYAALGLAGAAFVLALASAILGRSS